MYLASLFFIQYDGLLVGDNLLILEQQFLISVGLMHRYVPELSSEILAHRCNITVNNLH